MGISRTVSEINGDFSQKFPTPCILRPAEGVPLGIVGTGVRVQKARMMGLDTIHESETGGQSGRTNRHRPAAKTALTHSGAR